jgi:DNA-binding CsgD family transcriptional regulator
MIGSATLERDDELHRIAAALDAAAAGAGRAVVIEGPAGIGKSRLIADTRAMAKERGFGRLQAIGDELERAVAWSVVRQMVERSISRYSGETRRTLLAGPSGDALRTLDAAPEEAAVGDAAVARTLHALWWVAVDLSSYRPLLITVDDAQWSDLPSLRFLGYLSRRIADLPIAVVIGTRPPQERAGPLAELTAARDLERVEPRPLSEDAVAALGASRGEAPAPAVTAAVHAASGGNPFLATVLLDELERRHLAPSDPATAGEVGGLGPSAISRTMLARLPADATALATAAAVMGGRAEPWLAGEVAGLAQEALAPAADALRAAHVLTADAEHLTFVHPVIREAVLADVPPGELAALHGRAATTLLHAGAPAALLAAHLAAAPAGTLPGAADILRRAATQLTAEGDHGTAAEFLSRAREERPQDHALLADLGRALARSGRPEQGREHLRAAAATARGAERAELVAAAVAATAMVDGQQRAVEELAPLVEAWDGDDASRMVLEARLAQLRSMLPAETEPHVEHLRRFAGASGDTPAERTLLAMLAQRARYDGRPAAEVSAFALRALREGAFLADVDGTIEGMVAWVVAVAALASADAVEPANAEIARARERVREHGSPVEFAIVASIAAIMAYRCGDLVAAGAEAEAGLAAIAGEEPTPVVTATRGTTAWVGVYSAIERGELETAVAVVDQVPDTDPGVIPALWMGVARGRLALELDDPALAFRQAMEVGEAARSGRFDTPSIPWRVTAALAAQRLGRDEDAATLAREHLELARRTEAPTDLGLALRLSARIEPAARIERLDEAIAVLEGSHARFELAAALTDLGEALRVVKRRRDAREVLLRAAELAGECGARPLRQRAADALASIGDRPRELMFSGLEGLTASERRVAELASTGRSNREIAQELFVTPKTVENHLGRVYVKLGIGSRRELSTSLA